MSENPWLAIEPPSVADSFRARRVDARLAWNFFWARDADSKVLLTLRHADDAAPTMPLPRLRGIDVALPPSDSNGERILAIRLLDSSQQDIFFTLCQDIVSAATREESEAEAVSISLMRTWRWHRLLQGKGNDRLSPREQKGLIGELLALEGHLLPKIGSSVAVSAWLGPLGSSKDFEIARLAVEVKARRGGAEPYVAITSEHQLDDSGIDALFLYVVDLDEAPQDSENSLTVQSVAERIRDRILAEDPIAAGVFETRLLAAGLNPEDDYSDYRWLEGDNRFYAVSGKFPRIVARDIRSGVSRVRYSIALADCQPFATTSERLAKALEKL